MASVTGTHTSSDHAHLIPVRRSSGTPDAVALVVHGGRSLSQAEVRGLQVAVLRLRPIASAIARADRNVAVYRLQLAVRGWNGTGASALRDGRWALAELRALHPGLPIVLVGHSMGARTSFRLAGDPDVIGVVGLAPWLPADEPIQQLTGVPVHIIHGTGDRIVPEKTTRPYLARLRSSGVHLEQIVLSGTGHGMLRRWREWNLLAADAVASIVTVAQADPAVSRDVSGPRSVDAADPVS